MSDDPDPDDTAVEPDGPDADPDDPEDGLTVDPEALTDADRRAVLRAVAEDLRGETSESEQVAALIYRVSDVYDTGEDTEPRDVYVNMRNILRVKERGGRDPEPEGLDQG